MNSQRSLAEEMAIATSTPKVLNRIIRPTIFEVKQFCASHPSTREFKEVKIPVPWGHVSGKWYGRMDTRPIVAFHGQRNNAGSFDTIAPLLQSHVGFLSVDLPGHGFSSWLPDGCSYHVIDYVILIHRLMDEFKWDKISMMCHSMSGLNGFTFSSLYPHKCDMLINFDILKPIPLSTDETIRHLGPRLEAFNILDERNRKAEAPSYYEMSELVQRLHIGSGRSIDEKYCELILKRGVKESPETPQRYCFQDDQRLKSLLFYFLPQPILVDMARRILCPFLVIKSKQSPYYEDIANYNEILNVLKQKPTFSYHEVDGTHHFHLNEARKTADIVNPFIMQCRPE